MDAIAGTGAFAHHTSHAFGGTVLALHQPMAVPGSDGGHNPPFFGIIDGDDTAVLAKLESVSHYGEEVLDEMPAGDADTPYRFHYIYFSQKTEFDFLYDDFLFHYKTKY